MLKKVGNSFFAFSIILYLLIGVFIRIEEVSAKTNTSEVSITFELQDGSLITWKDGDKKFDIDTEQISYIFFGSYPQTEITGEALTKEIKNAKYNTNGYAVVNGDRYKRLSIEDDESYIPGKKRYKWQYDWSQKEYAYCKNEPIKWRVLSCERGKALLLSEDALDVYRYYTEYKDITWAESTIRKWLNGEFYRAAFSNEESKMVKKTKIKNDNNPRYETFGGKSTKDSVFLLSIEDMVNPKYGFDEDPFRKDIKRRCAVTDYAIAKGVYHDYSKNSKKFTQDNRDTAYWYLRSPGAKGNLVATIYQDGVVWRDGFPVDDREAVRPAIYLDLSKIIKD